MSEEETTQENGAEGTERTAILKAKIGRFDGTLREVGFHEGDTVQVLATKAGFNLSGGESINDDDGNDVGLSEQANEDQTYWIVGNYKQG